MYVGLYSLRLQYKNNFICRTCPKQCRRPSSSYLYCPPPAAPPRGLWLFSRRNTRAASRCLKKDIDDDELQSTLYCHDDDAATPRRVVKQSIMLCIIERGSHKSSAMVKVEQLSAEFIQIQVSDTWYSVSSRNDIIVQWPTDKYSWKLRGAKIWVLLWKVPFT